MDRTGWITDLYDVPGHKVKSRPQARQVIKLYERRLPPRVWLTWLKGFGATPATAQQLWRVLLKTHRGSEIGCIVRAGRRGDRRSVGEMLGVMTPSRLLQLTAWLSPEGQPRDPQVIDVEARIVEAAMSPTVWR
jgi:hypothetical protein